MRVAVIDHLYYYLMKIYTEDCMRDRIRQAEIYRLQHNCIDNQRNRFFTQGCRLLKGNGADLISSGRMWGYLGLQRKELRSLGV